MIDRLDHMLERPRAETPGFDLFSDVLRAVRLQAAYFYKVVANEPWCVTTDDARICGAGILPQCEHRIAYHVLVQGRCWGGVVGAPLRAMQAGDIIVFPGGGPQQMASASNARPQRPRVSLPESPALPFKLELGGKGPRSSIFVCGFLGCDRRLRVMSPSCSKRGSASKCASYSKGKNLGTPKDASMRRMPCMSSAVLVAN